MKLMNDVNIRFYVLQVIHSRSHQRSQMSVSLQMVEKKRGRCRDFFLYPSVLKTSCTTGAEDELLVVVHWMDAGMGFWQS